ncbi:MAG: Ig-like domain-containing protein, partial [Cyanobacteriota bacterium]|nr:Ig-like domain-containing protein [Cyanobacteriota bacterium]
MTDPSWTSSEGAPLSSVASDGPIVVVADQPEDQALGLSLEEHLLSGLEAVWTELASRASEPAFLDLLVEVFGATAEGALVLASRIAGGDMLGLRYEIETGAEMGGATGAFAAVGDDGVATIYINGDWLAVASSEQLRLVLLEEIGHGLDMALNGGVDTAGDEGELFAQLFSGVALSEEQRASIASNDDSVSFLIDSAEVSAEGAVANNSLSTSIVSNSSIRSFTFSASGTSGGTGSGRQGQDLLIALFSGSTLVGWRIYDNVITSQNWSISNQVFALAGLISDQSISSLTVAAYQGYYITTGSLSGTGSSIPFAIHSSASSNGSLANIALTSTTANGDKETYLNVVVDGTPPAPTLALSNDSGISGDQRTKEGALTFSALEAGGSRVIKVNGTTVPSYTPPSTDGVYTVEVTDTDAAGNSGSASVTFTLDTEAPKPTVDLADDSGSADDDGLTNTGALTFSALEAGGSRVIQVNGVEVESYSAPTEDGEYTVEVTDT